MKSNQQTNKVNLTEQEFQALTDGGYIQAETKQEAEDQLQQLVDRLDVSALSEDEALRLSENFLKSFQIDFRLITQLLTKTPRELCSNFDSNDDAIVVISDLVKRFNQTIDLQEELLGSLSLTSQLSYAYLALKKMRSEKTE